jgi:hypothetical protein
MWSRLDNLQREVVVEKSVGCGEAVKKVEEARDRAGETIKGKRR